MVPVAELGEGAVFKAEEFHELFPAFIKYPF